MFWCYGVLVHIMKYFLTSIFLCRGVLLILWRTFWCNCVLFDVMLCYDVVLMLWRIFCVMAYFWCYGLLFDVMAYFLMLCCTFWCYDVVFDVMAYFCAYHGVLFDVMEYFLMLWRICYVMAYLLTSRRTSWRICWYYNILLMCHDVLYCLNE